METSQPIGLITGVTEGIHPPFQPYLRRWFVMTEDDMNGDGLKTTGDIPKPWRDVFALIREALPGTVMAGGCLRDRDIGVKVKDIDLFVPERKGKSEDLDMIVKIMLDMGAQSATVDGDKMYPTGVDNHIVGVVNVKFISCPLEFQLVVGEWGSTVEQLFECFDYGICQIAYDGKTITRSPNYWTDRKTKSFRLCTRRSRRAFQQSIERYARLKLKYPDWKFDLGHFDAAYGGHNGGPVSGEFNYSIAPWRSGGEAIRPKRPGDIITHVDVAGMTQQQASRLSRVTMETILRYIDGKPDLLNMASADD